MSASLTQQHPLNPDIDAAYHAKYDRHGPRIVGTVVGPHLAETTLKLEPLTHD